MDENPNEEFFEALNQSENEYYDALCQNITNNICNYWFDETQHLNILKQGYSQEKENSSAALRRNEISSIIDPTNQKFGYLLHYKMGDIDKIDSADLLETILNEESLNKIYFEEKSLTNNIEGTIGDTEAENKINLWSYINNNSQNHNKSCFDSGQHNRENKKIDSIEKEVEELELEIEKMFNSRSLHKLNMKQTSSYEKNNLKEYSNENVLSSVRDEKKVSPSTSCMAFVETSTNNRISSISEETDVLDLDETTHRKCSFNEMYLSVNVPSSVSASTFNPVLASAKNRSETESSIEHKEFVTLRKVGSEKAIPIHSVDIIPKLIEIQRNIQTRKFDKRNNPDRNELINSNICTIKQAHTGSFRRKYSKVKTSQEFKKARSLFVSSAGSKRVNNKFSKGLHSERSNHHKISNANQSGSHINLEVIGKMQVPEKKLKKNNLKKLKYEISEIHEREENNKAVSKKRIKKMNFSEKKDAKNVCSISLILEPTCSNVAMKELMKSMKDYYWITESSKERALLQLVILCVTDSVQKISIKNEMFKLYCRNEFSASSYLESDMGFEQSKNEFRSEPLFIETISSESQVHRLGLLNGLDTHEFQNIMKGAETEKDSYSQEKKKMRKK